MTHILLFIKIRAEGYAELKGSQNARGRELK